MKLLLLFLLCLLGVPGAKAVAPDTIPLHMEHNLLFIPVQIDGQPHRFILDTGATTTLIGEHLLHETDAACDSIPVTDVSGRTHLLLRRRFHRLQLGAQTMPSLAVLPIQTEGTLWECLGAEGFIGSDVWQGRMLTIDVKHGYALIGESGSLPRSLRKYRVPMQLGQDGRPYIDIQVGQLTMPQALFDSGDTGLFSPNAYSFQQLRTRFTPAIWKGQVTDAAVGSHTFALHGAVPPDSLWRVDFPQWRLGNASFEGVSSVAGGPAPLSSVGAPLAKYGRIVIDYGEKRFYFIPYEDAPQVEPLPDVGFQLADGRIAVGLVWPRSKAYAQGLRAGMRVQAVNGEELDDDICRLLQLRDTKVIETLTVDDGRGRLLVVRF